VKSLAAQLSCGVTTGSSCTAGSGYTTGSRQFGPRAAQERPHRRHSMSCTSSSPSTYTRGVPHGLHPLSPGAALPGAGCCLRPLEGSVRSPSRAFLVTGR